MQLSVSIRLPEKYIKMADEIRIGANDIVSSDKLHDIITNYPEKTICCVIQYDLNLDELNTIKMFKESCNNLICAVSTLSQAIFCKENNIRFYFNHYITSYYEMQAALDLGAGYIIPGASLFFDLPKLKDKGVAVRAIPNVAYMDGFKRENGIVGSWIRPQDLELYDNYIDIVEFKDCNDIEKEKLLIKIYFEDKEWLGQLRDLITNFDYQGFCGLINSDLAKRRIKCKQRCQENGICHYCKSSCDMATEDFMNKLEP